LNLTDKSVLVVDRGLFVSLAERLVGVFGKVGYFTYWESAFGDGRELVIGCGLKGIERVKYFEEVYRNYDLLVFPDVYDGWMVKDLRDHGFRVWGSGLGSELETLRWKTKQRFKELGLPVNESYRVHGVNELRTFLQEHTTDSGWFIKVSLLRGLGETWKAENYEQAKGFIDEFEAKNGGLSHLMHFIIEAPIPDCDEVGYDGYCIDGQFPSSSMYGWEVKDCAYIGQVSDYSDLPLNVRKVNDALSEPLREFQYRNFFSTELRNEYCIDPTCRHASPAGEVLVQNIDNIGDVLWSGAEGVMVDPVFKYKYGAQIILSSEWARDHWQLVQFHDEIREHVKLYNHCRVNDGNGNNDYVVPQFVPHFDKMQEIGSVVALDDDPEEAVSKCKEYAEQVKGFKVTCDCDSLDKAYEEMQSVSSSPSS
jgi:hypothetical protein